MNDEKKYREVDPNHAAYATEFQKGLTKREYFAAMAMQGIVAKFGIFIEKDFETHAREAVGMADGLINELNK